MDTTGSEKRNTNPKSTLFERLILQTNKREKIRTSLPLSTGHHGRRRRGGERPEGLPEVRIKEGRGGEGIGVLATEGSLHGGKTRHNSSYQLKSF
jgi:hypothetical protein